MLATMRAVFKAAFTGRDNETTDIARVLWALSMLVMLGLQVVNFRGFDIHAFATSASLLLASGGAAVAIKAHTEPPSTGGSRAISTPKPDGR